MKRAIIGISLVTLILLFWFGFSQSVEEEVVGEVIVISGENVYTPFRQAVSGQKGNTTWDGMPLLRPNSEYLLELPSILYKDNFSFDLRGGKPIQGDYTLYDNNLEQIYYWRTDSFRLPSSPGEYILCLWQTWSNGRKAIGAENANYQYYVVNDDIICNRTDDIKCPEPDVSTVQMISENKAKAADHGQLQTNDQACRFLVNRFTGRRSNLA